MNIIPMVLDSSNNKETIYDIYSLLLNHRIIFLTGEIDDNIASLITGQLLYLDSLNNDDISLYINSPGGSVSAGLSIYDTIKYIKSNVITIGLGMCASMGAFILSSGDKRYALPNCEVMIHEPLGGGSGQATDIKILSDHILKVKDKINHILAKNTGKKVSQIEKDTRCDNYMSAEEALKYGLIDKIIKND